MDKGKMVMGYLRFSFFAALLLFAGSGCAPTVMTDYTAFRLSRPRSILVLPPLNNSPDVEATYGFLSTVTQPLAESGYYVFPVALVDQTFKENGMLNPGEMHQAPIPKLREIFGADATLYITVTQYGSSYRILSSEIRVTAKAELIDNRDGQLLWQGAATAAKSGGNSSGGLAGMLAAALVEQIINNIGDQTIPVAREASKKLLEARPNGLLYGPRSPFYETD
jgi:hypothetical protein